MVIGNRNGKATGHHIAISIRGRIGKGHQYVLGLAKLGILDTAHLEVSLGDREFDLVVVEARADRSSQTLCTRDSQKAAFGLSRHRVPHRIRNLVVAGTTGLFDIKSEIINENFVAGLDGSPGHLAKTVLDRFSKIHDIVTDANESIAGIDLIASIDGRDQQAWPHLNLGDRSPCRNTRKTEINGSDFAHVEW